MRENSSSFKISEYLVRAAGGWQCLDTEFSVLIALEHLTSPALRRGGGSCIVHGAVCFCFHCHANTTAKPADY